MSVHMCEFSKMAFCLYDSMLLSMFYLVSTSAAVPEDVLVLNQASLLVCLLELMSLQSLLLSFFSWL